MAEPVKSKKKKKAPKRERRERRFTPKQTHTSVASVVAGAIGSGVLGAGVWSQWVSEVPRDYARWLVTGGVIVLGAALWFGDTSALPVRVGDAGIAVEKGDEVVRVAWCDLERVSIEGGQLIAKGDELTLSIPVGAHPQAIAWILAEGTRRVPKAMDVKGSAVEVLPKPSDGDGEILTIDELQIAGRHCAASDIPIAFEGDARFCANCAQVYHKDHVPKTCVTCDEPVAGRG